VTFDFVRYTIDLLNLLLSYLIRRSPQTSEFVAGRSTMDAVLALPEIHRDCGPKFSLV